MSHATTASRVESACICLTQPCIATFCIFSGKIVLPRPLNRQRAAQTRGVCGSGVAAECTAIHCAAALGGAGGAAIGRSTAAGTAATTTAAAGPRRRRRPRGGAAVPARGIGGAIPQRPGRLGGAAQRGRFRRAHQKALQGRVKQGATLRSMGFHGVDATFALAMHNGALRAPTVHPLQSRRCHQKFQHRIIS